MKVAFHKFIEVQGWKLQSSTVTIKELDLIDV